MKKYTRLICTICARTIDKLVDNQRVAPDLCTITLRCQGRLVPVEYRSNGQITTAPEAGITDWTARTTKATLTTTGSSTLATQTLIDTAAGTYRQLVLAVKVAADPGDLSTASLQLAERSDTPKVFQQYIFRRDTSFNTINGIESGLAQKTLRFTAYGTNPDLVEVYLDGVQLEQGTAADQFQLYDGISSTVAPNTISFNTLISPSGTGQVDVIVSKAEVLTTVTLDFVRHQDDDNRRSTGAWENISYIDRFSTAWDRYYLFRFDVSSNTVMRLNTILYPTGSLTVNGLSVPLSDAIFLLAREPYTILDRYPDISVPLSTLSADRDYLKYHAVSAVNRLEVTETSLQTFFPTSRLGRFNVETTIKTQTTANAGQTDQVVVDGSVIVGPDA